MTDQEFGKLVNDGIKQIPKKFLDLMDNVAIVIEDQPSARQLRKSGLKPGWTLFGLYEGIPRTKRGPHYFGVLPDKITIFRIPIEERASSPAEAKALVAETVWHEIAHHFGMDEDRVRKAEKKRR